VGQDGGRRGRAQHQDASHELSNVRVGGRQTFGVQFAERDMQGPLAGSDLVQTVQGQIEALADADSGGAGEQQGVGRQIVGAAQFLLQELVVLWGKRPGR
jgi:hypothetical protein